MNGQHRQPDQPNLQELDYQRRMMLETPRYLPVRVYQRNIINTRNEFGRRVRNGIKGQADMEVIVLGTGLHVEMEAKAVDGVMSPEQLKWQAFCQRSNIPHLVVRVLRKETPEETITRWIQELRTCIESHVPRHL